MMAPWIRLLRIRFKTLDIKMWDFLLGPANFLFQLTWGDHHMIYYVQHALDNDDKLQWLKNNKYEIEITDLITGLVFVITRLM